MSDETFRERFERYVERYCEPLTPHELNQYLHISLQHRFVYVEIPKNACSTLKFILRRVELDDVTIENTKQIHNRQYSPLLRPCQLWDVDALLNSSQFKRFTFVRNPYTRVLSAFLDKIAGNNRRLKEPLFTILDRDIKEISSPISFVDFLRAIRQQSPLEMDHHWRQQSIQAFYPKLSYDFIGRFERLDEDIERLGGVLGIDLRKYYYRHAPHNTNAGERLKEYYDDESIRLVKQIYAEDFDLFEYPTDIETYFI
jgi:hypothetical protein